MLPAILALLSSATFGAADFLGGLATRRGSMVAVVVMSQAAGLLLVFAMLPFLPPAAATTRDAAWGAGAGLAGGAGVGLLYHGLATAPMAIVAPVTAVCAVVVPVLVGVASGETLSGRTLAGIALAAVAIVLVGQGGFRRGVGWPAARRRSPRGPNRPANRLRHRSLPRRAPAHAAERRTVAAGDRACRLDLAVLRRRGNLYGSHWRCPGPQP